MPKRLVPTQRQPRWECPDLPITNRCALLALAALTGPAAAAPFPPTSVLALRAGVAGDGALAGSLAAAQFLDVVDAASGSVTATVALPSARGAAGAAAPAVTAYISAAEGLVGLSGDGTLLVITGYDASAGVYYPKGESWAAVPRAVATVNCSGGVTADTSVADESLAEAGNLRHAATYDGSWFYLSTELNGLLLARRGAGGAAARVDDPAAALASPRAVAVEWDAAAQPAPRLQLFATGDGGLPNTLRGCAAAAGKHSAQGRQARRRRRGRLCAAVCLCRVRPLAARGRHHARAQSARLSALERCAAAACERQGQPLQQLPR